MGPEAASFGGETNATTSEDSGSWRNSANNCTSSSVLMLHSTRTKSVHRFNEPKLGISLEMGLQRQLPLEVRAAGECRSAC